MSLMVDEKGRAKTYAIVNIHTQTLVAGCSTIQDAMKAKRTPGDDLTIHNVTHPNCPDWLKATIMADPAYCEARATEYQSMANGLRRKATAILGEADQFQAISDRYSDAARNARTSEEPR